MSTYLYLVCESHTPPIVADDESGQHLYDLPQIRSDLANRDLIAKVPRGPSTLLLEHPRRVRRSANTSAATRPARSMTHGEV